MTHEELLMRLWEKRNAQCDNLDVHSALSTAVELHKPIETRDFNLDKYLACEICELDTNDGVWHLEYPCPTIQAIMRELK